MQSRGHQFAIHLKMKKSILCTYIHLLADDTLRWITLVKSICLTSDIPNNLVNCIYLLTTIINQWGSEFNRFSFNGCGYNVPEAVKTLVGRDLAKDSI